LNFFLVAIRYILVNGSLILTFTPCFTGFMKTVFLSFAVPFMGRILE